VTAPRFSVLASLPALGGFRRALALDRAGAARAVVLGFAPPAVADDPARLVALLRDVEAAARLHHPGAAPVLGTETIGGELAVVELHRPGATLRALLDASGRLPPDVAARIALDVCAALARAHAIDAGDGVRLVHGALDAARIVVGEDGTAFVCGLGLAGGGDPAADLRALARVLHEVLAGEPPADPPRRLDVPGIPEALASAVDRAAGVDGPPFASAAVLGEAIAAAAPATTHAAVAAYADAILPADEGERAELGRALASALGAVPAEVVDELVVEPTDPQVRAPPPGPPAGGGPTAPPRTPDAVGTFPKPGRPPRASRVPAIVAVLGLAVGIAAGFALSRGAGLALSRPELLRRVRAALSRRMERPASPGASRVEPGADPTRPAAPRAHARDAEVAAPPPARAPAAAAGPPSAPSPPGRMPKRPARTAAARAGPQRGTLDVTAPADALVLLDGRRIAQGSVKVEIGVGAHRIEVRRAGASVAERFTLEPGETWTYAVTPTVVAPAP